MQPANSANPLNIAVIAHIRHAIAEPFMGGMEAHCRLLCDALRHAGHRVTLFAAGRSHDSCLVPICSAPYEDVLPWRTYRGTSELGRYQHHAFAKAWKHVCSGGFDVVHNNSLFPAIMEWAARDDVPLVTSQHVPPFGVMREQVEAVADAPVVQHTVTSSDQLTAWSRDARRHMAVVHNGVRTDRWTPAASVGEDFVWVGRVTPNKGTAYAARAARMANMRLKIYGPVEDARYFAQEVDPLLGEGIEYLGHVPLGTLRPIVASAKAMLVTPLWDEPFGLVAAEALSCGTPVCAFDNGALAEVIGPCGHVVAPKDLAALAEAMRKVENIDRAACRTRALTMFSAEAMVEGYEQAYLRAMLAARPQRMRASIAQTEAA